MKKRNPQFHAESPLLKLLDQRFKSLGLEKGVYKKPARDIYSDAVRDIAAKAHADVNVSDPFARARITLYMKQGYELPSDVLAEANSKLKAKADGHNRNSLQAAA